MKKIALILLACVYALSSLGIGIKQFYCCGKLKSVTIKLTPDKKESCNKCNGKKGCCDSKYHFFKVRENHLSENAVDIPLISFIDLDLFTSKIQSISIASPQINLINGSHAPPLYTGVALYIYNCVFII